MKNIFDAFWEGFVGALRLYVALVAAPFAVMSAFVRHADMKSSQDRAHAHWWEV